jgi:hypothetical protein
MDFWLAYKLFVCLSHLQFHFDYQCRIGMKATSVAAPAADAGGLGHGVTVLRSFGFPPTMYTLLCIWGCGHDGADVTRPQVGPALECHVGGVVLSGGASHAHVIQRAVIGVLWSLLVCWQQPSKHEGFVFA